MSKKKIHKIEIEDDGWVSITFSDGTQKGLGDLNVDVQIHHNGVDKSFSELMQMIPHEEDTPYCWCKPKNITVEDSILTVHRCPFCQLVGNCACHSSNQLEND